MIRDRIVVGVRDDSTRHKLLQIHNLTLAKAVDICKASEAAGDQLKVMSKADKVLLLHSSKRMAARGREKSRGRGQRDDSQERKSTLLKCK